MKKLIQTIFLFVLCHLIYGCSPSSQTIESNRWMEDNGRVKVLSSIAMINDIVGQVGGEHVDSLVLITGELDPHTYQLVKGDDEKLARADIIFYNGLGLEHGPSLREYLQKSDKTVGLGDKIRVKEPHVILFADGQVDPHIWMDISMWRKTVPYIVEKLSVYDPEHAETYQKNGNKLLELMLKQHESVKKKLQMIPKEKRYLVTSHDAFNYFARTYLAADNEKTQTEWQDRFAAPEGLAPESQLSTTDIQLIIDHMKKYQIEVLFPESNVSQDSIRKILDAGNENGMNLRIANSALYGDSMGRPGTDGDTYLKMIDHNATVIANNLMNQNIKP